MYVFGDYYSIKSASSSVKLVWRSNLRRSCAFPPIAANTHNQKRVEDYHGENEDDDDHCDDDARW